MLLSVILPVLMSVIGADASDVTRDFFGDVFHMRDCHNGSRCDGGGRRAALQVPGRRCYCQCAPTHLAYREDKQQCVKEIKECYMSVFYRPFTVEAIPLVYLPTSGQLVHPDAHLSLSMRRNFESGLAKCRVTISQYLTREGWRTLSKADGSGNSIFGLFTDANKTYLQFLGNSHDRKLLQQHLALIRLLCIIPQYPAFETCVAIRVGWVPGVENIDDVPASGNKANMLVVGLSLGVLALVYIFAVLVYLKIRRQMIAKQKGTINDQEAKLQSCDEEEDKTPNLHRLESSSRLELYHTTSLGRQKHNKSGYGTGIDPWNQLSPIVETFNRTWTDRMGQHSSEFTAQDFKLEPEFFEPEFMASPPHEVLEYLERLQNSITFARHRMRSCYRYQPTLNGIPEDDYYYQELERKDSQQNKEIRTTPDGGSASSSVGSLQESSDGKNDLRLGDLPKIPPRKPKRKTVRTERILECAPQSSDHEQKEIQKAMNALNDTLDALEYDIYKQEVLNQASDTETANLSCQNSTSIDFDDFETSSCSSMSVATILGREGRRLSDISKCSQFLEKNQSEDVSTFYNSTYNMQEAMRGLFHDANKIKNTIESDLSNESSRCTSRNEFAENTSKSGLERSDNDLTKELNTTDNTTERMNCDVKDHEDMIERYLSGGTNNFSEERNIVSPNSENGLKKPKSPIPDYTLKIKRQNNIQVTSSSPIRDNSESDLNQPLEKCELRDDGDSVSFDSERQIVNIPNTDKQMSPNPPSRNITPEEKKHRNIKTPDKINIKEVASSKGNQSRTPTPNKEHRQTNTKSPNILHSRTPTPNKDHRQTDTKSPNILQSRTPTPNKDHSQSNSTTPNRLRRGRTVRSPTSSKDGDHKNSSDSEGPHPLRKCPSNESMTTTATDMTTDSLESRGTSPSHPSPTPSLMEMWITKLVSTSVPYSKSRRKSKKKKIVLPEEEIEGWQHVCQKQHKDPCPLHDLNDSEPNIIDKLAHYGSKTMAGCDVAGYFQSLKQDVLKEHLRAWISSNCQRHKKGTSPSTHRKPLVKGQESNLVDENGMHLSGLTDCCPLEASNDVTTIPPDDQISPDDSLELNSMEVLIAHANH